MRSSVRAAPDGSRRPCSHSCKVGSSAKFLKLGMINELEITLPSVQEQDRQLKLLSGLLEQIENLESIYRQKLTALDDLKKSLLHQAFRGQL